MKKTIGLSMKPLVLGAVICLLLAGQESARADVEFGVVTNLGPLVNSEVSDFGCCISSDGLSLIFSSSRPPANAFIWDYDLWMTTRATENDDWGPAEYLGDVLNTRQLEIAPCLSADGLELYYAQGPTGNTDICVSRRNTLNDPWSAPENLGPMVNSTAWDTGPSLTADGLELYFNSSRSGNHDLYVCTRATTADSWGQALNLGPVVNSTETANIWGDTEPSISPDGLTLLFSSIRPTSSTLDQGNIWMTRRSTRQSEWGSPVLLGLPGYSINSDFSPSFSEGMLYFGSGRSGFMWSIYQVEINTIVDFNGDASVDILDVYELLEHWESDNSLYDIAPAPFGDGVVNAKDLKVLAEHMIILEQSLDMNDL